MNVTPLGAALRALLLSDPNVEAAVSERVVPGALEAGCALPALVYQRTGGEPGQEHDGLAGYEQADVQLDAWAWTDEQAEALGVAARSVLVERSPGWRFGSVAIDSIAVQRDRGCMRDAGDKTDDRPAWRYSFDVVVGFTRL